MQIAILCALAVAVLCALAVWVIRRRALTPEKREQRRRLALHETGRIGDALVTEASEDALFYSYTIRGVQYTASQDVTSLRVMLPTDMERLIGPAGMKYSTSNPANSILICEEWIGLRAALAHENPVRHQTHNAALAKGA